MLPLSQTSSCPPACSAYFSLANCDLNYFKGIDVVFLICGIIWALASVWGIFFLFKTFKKTPRKRRYELNSRNAYLICQWIGCSLVSVYFFSVYGRAPRVASIVLGLVGLSLNACSGYYCLIDLHSRLFISMNMASEDKKLERLFNFFAGFVLVSSIILVVICAVLSEVLCEEFYSIVRVFFCLDGDCLYTGYRINH